MPRGGKRKGAGRPKTGETIRKTVSWRLPISLLTRIHKNAEFEGVHVTAWVERVLFDALRRNSSNTTALRRIASTDEDPLACVDEEATEEEILQQHIEAEIESETRREKILAMCIPIEEAEGLAKRSRQRLEGLPDEGRLIALRVRNRWMYPRWQFDPDSRGGIVPGLEDVLKYLQLSPTGVALWLTDPFKGLGNRRPIDLLKAGEQERKKVIHLAQQQGHMA